MWFSFALFPLSIEIASSRAASYHQKTESECLIFVISDRHTECAPCLLVTRNGNGLFYIKRRATLKLPIHGKLQCKKCEPASTLYPGKWLIVVVVSLRCAGVKIGVAMGRIRCSRYFNYCLLHRNSLMKWKYHTRRKRAKKRKMLQAQQNSVWRKFWKDQLNWA